MRGPSIQKTAAVSLMLHLMSLVLSVILINYSKNVVMPSPFTVSLVSPSKGRSSGEPVYNVGEPKSIAVEKAKSPDEIKEVTKTVKKTDEKRLNERMSELEAIAKLKRNKEIRTKIAEISGKASIAKSTARPSDKQGPAGGKGTPTDMYIAKISAEIWNAWGFPGERKKGLEAVVSVTIRRDGTIKINDFEKRSGDPLFDKSVLKALTYASPVTRPEDEMEIGIRFKP
jgi:outer membrane biosynthesis protein TonB